MAETVLYDESLGGYVMDTRLYPAERQVVAICEAEDFRRWGTVPPLIWPGLDKSQWIDIHHNVRTLRGGMSKVGLRGRTPPMCQRSNSRAAAVIATTPVSSVGSASGW